jgi:hypothetical protein
VSASGGATTCNKRTTGEKGSENTYARYRGIAFGFHSSISSQRACPATEPKVLSPVRSASNRLLPVKDTFGQENECLPT